jgi:hypothetical protein
MPGGRRRVAGAGGVTRPLGVGIDSRLADLAPVLGDGRSCPHGARPRVHRRVRPPRQRTPRIHARARPLPAPGAAPPALAHAGHGAPHGAPAERDGNWVNVALRAAPFTRPLARLAPIRSAGVTDLRPGSVLERDREGRDRLDDAHAACATSHAATPQMRRLWTSVVRFTIRGRGTSDNGPGEFVVPAPHRLPQSPRFSRALPCWWRFRCSLDEFWITRAVSWLFRPSLSWPQRWRVARQRPRAPPRPLVLPATHWLPTCW